MDTNKKEEIFKHLEDVISKAIYEDRAIEETLQATIEMAVMVGLMVKAVTPAKNGIFKTYFLQKLMRTWDEASEEEDIWN